VTAAGLKHDEKAADESRSIVNRYFLLLMRFITDDHTPDERQAIYDRARRALLQQLLEADPGGADSQSAYERLTFEEAVRTVEAGVARWGHRDRS
jgi:hypothetical protein